MKIEGGVAANVVPADASAWLKGYKAADLPESAYIDFHDEDDLVVLEVDGYGLPFCEGAGYEITVSESISPDRIRVKEYC